MSKPKLLIVEDDESIRNQMKWALVDDYDVTIADDRSSAIEVFSEHQPALIILDLGLPPDRNGISEGFKTLSEILERDQRTKVIVVTGQDGRDNALESIARGAYDFFSKPILIDELKVVLRRSHHVYRLEKEYLDLQQRLGVETFAGMLGTSPKMQDVYSSVRKVATTDIMILIEGESGAGKEMVARAIHTQSPRRGGPFVVINSGAIPESLLESELFGHEKGAFTGAHTRRKGRIETASKGTLFLDEVGELPLALQVKLLRFLQEHTIERVGGREEIVVDARVIAASNRDLEKATADGAFREDLYYRLSVVKLSVPPLRERGEDIILLAKHFAQRFADEHRSAIKGFDKKALQSLRSHSWPGNVRELENRIRRGVVMAEGQKLAPEDLELETPNLNRPEGMGLKAARERLERDMIQKALARNRGNISQSASDLGVSRPTLYELMEKLGIHRS